MRFSYEKYSKRFTQPLENDGLDINVRIVNAVFFTIIASMVIYLTYSKVNVIREEIAD